MEVWKYFSWRAKFSCRSCNQKDRRGPILIKDDDVIAEENRVAMQSGERSGSHIDDYNDHQLSDSEVKRDPRQKDCIRVNNFQKIYEPPFQQPIMAVRQASFGLDYGECFALLGVNGAGKSTTFKSLTREITPTLGEISIQGYDI